MPMLRHVSQVANSTTKRSSDASTRSRDREIRSSRRIWGADLRAWPSTCVSARPSGLDPRLSLPAELQMAAVRVADPAGGGAGGGGGGGPAGEVAVVAVAEDLAADLVPADSVAVVVARAP